MPASNSLSDLFHDTLRDIYYAEKHILKALPKMAKGAEDDRLKDAFTKHKEQTTKQIERLEKVFAVIGKTPRAKKCDAIEGILKEGNAILEDYEGSECLDAGLIAAAQAVEHYEITRYGTLKRWARMLDLKDAEKLLDASLKEESSTDESLTKLADSYANETALVD